MPIPLKLNCIFPNDLGWLNVKEQLVAINEALRFEIDGFGLNKRCVIVAVGNVVPFNNLAVLMIPQ